MKRTIILGVVLTTLVSLSSCALYEKGIHESNVLYYQVRFASVDSITPKNRYYNKYYLSSIPGRYYSLTDYPGKYIAGDTIRMSFDIKSRVKIKTLKQSK
jgi:hypothetical protein